MRLFLFALALVAVAGCDTLSTTGSEGATFMERLDGTWTRTITTERIATGGTITSEGSVRTDAFEIGRRIRCNVTELESAGDSDRIAVAFDPAFPEASRTCSVLSTDGDARRLILVGDGGSIVQDVVATVETDSESRQVWAFYAFDGAETVRTVWTLTR